MRLQIKFIIFFYFTLFLLLCIDFSNSLRYKLVNQKPKINLLDGDLNPEYKFADALNEINNDEILNQSNGKLDKQSIDQNELKLTEIKESPIETLLAITRVPIQLAQTIFIENETSKHVREISDIIGYNLKKIVKKFFKIANEALDNFNTINNAGLLSAIIQFANFMTKVNQFVSPAEWQTTFMNFDIASNIRIPLNLRSPNAHHEQIFDVKDL